MIAELENFNFAENQNELKNRSFSELFILLERQISENEMWNEMKIEGRSPSDPERITLGNNLATQSISRFLSEAYKKAADNDIVGCFEKFMQARIALEQNHRYFNILLCSYMEDAAVGILLRSIIKKFSGLWLDCAEEQFKLLNAKFQIENEREISILIE